MSFLPYKHLPADAGALRAPRPAPYVYRTPLKRAVALGLDALGHLALARQPEPIDWTSVKRVAVLRLDHLGDLLNALPALRRLRSALPRARLDLWVGPWGQELASMFADVDQVHVAQADWFARPQRVEWPWTQIEALGSALSAQHYDAVLDLRGDLRHWLAMFQSGADIRSAPRLTAGAFLLSHPQAWKDGLHEQEQALALLDGLGLAPAKQLKTPALRLTPAAIAEAEAVFKALKLSGAPLMVQAACGTPAKRWPLQAWAQVLEKMPRGRSAVLLGSGAEKEEMQALAAQVKRPLALATGRLSLPALAAFLNKAGLLLSVDSGPAHLATALGKPVLMLASGTNLSSQWAPKGARVLQAPPPPCSPCERTECPYDNACMQALEVESVLKAVKEMLAR